MDDVAVVYKITYPNGKIYVGQDRTNNINYFGSADADIIASDFSWEERQIFSVTREILWSGVASRSEITRIEIEWIQKLGSNSPSIGYNRFPKRDRKKV